MKDVGVFNTAPFWHNGSKHGMTVAIDLNMWEEAARELSEPFYADAADGDGQEDDFVLEAYEAELDNEWDEVDPPGPALDTEYDDGGAELDVKPDGVPEDADPSDEVAEVFVDSAPIGAVQRIAEVAIAALIFFLFM